MNRFLELLIGTAMPSLSLPNGHSGRRRLPSETRHTRRLRDGHSRQQTSRSRERTPRDRRQRASSAVVNIDDDGTWTEVSAGTSNTNGSSCIDLTTSGDDDIIDLTSPTTNGELRPVVLAGSSSTSVSPRRRRRGRIRTPRRRSSRSRQDNPVINTGNNISVIDNDEDDSVLELPDPGLTSNAYQVELDSSVNTSINSPGARKITCPVCMDDDKQIRRSGRQLNSTTCGHIFCNECIRSAINAQHACPSCRKRLTLRQIHPIFI